MPRVTRTPDDRPRVLARHCCLSRRRQPEFLPEIAKTRTIIGKWFFSSEQITFHRKLQQSPGRSSCFDLKQKQQLQAHRHSRVIVKGRYFHRKENFFRKKKNKTLTIYLSELKRP